MPWIEIAYSLLQDAVLKFVAIASLKAFHGANGYAPIDLYDSSGAIIASFLRISYLVQHVKFRFSMVPPRGPQKFQRRSCAGILGVLPYRPP